MPKRLRTHELEDRSRARLHTIFENCGWVVEDIDKDYGEDLLVRIFRDGVATPLKFFVQAKASDNLAHHTSKRNDTFHLNVSSDHVRQWNKFLEPVILTLWDSRSGDTYWVCVQDIVGGSRALRPTDEKKSVRVRIPCGNVLDNSGIEQIRILTSERHRRLIAERIGAEVLMDYLDRKYGIKVEYSPDAGVVNFFGTRRRR